jgi:hypothetical protein
MLNLFGRLTEWRERAKARQAEFDRRLEEFRQKWETEIKPLPIEEAKRRAEALLSDRERCMCSSGPVSVQERLTMELLAPHLKEFFERYSFVCAGYDPSECLDRDLLTFPNGQPGEQYLYIGLDGCENNYVVKPGEEAIRILGAYHEEGEIECESLYHVLLKMDLFQSKL